jgi:hypothetical protein
MTSRITPIPHKMPNAPKEYDVSYFNQLNRQLERVLNDLNQPAIAKSGGLYIDINSLPISGVDLRPGFVYRDGPFLMIVLEGSAYLSTNLINVSLGTLTVSV